MVFDQSYMYILRIGETEYFSINSFSDELQFYVRREQMEFRSSCEQGIF